MGATGRPHETPTRVGSDPSQEARLFLRITDYLGHVAADPVGHGSGGAILHSVAVLARLSGGVEVAPLAGAVIGTLLTIMLGAIGNPSPRRWPRSAGAPF